MRAVQQSRFDQVGFLPQTTGRELSSKTVSVMLDFCPKPQGAGCQAKPFLSCWMFAPNHRARAVKQSRFCHVEFLPQTTELSSKAVSIKLDFCPKPQDAGCQAKPFLSCWMFAPNHMARAVKQSRFCHVGFLPQTTGRGLSSKAVSVMLDFCPKPQGAGCQASQFLSSWTFAPNHRARAVKQSSFCHVGFLPQTTGRGLSSKAVSVMLDFCPKPQGAGCQASQFLSSWTFAPNHRARAVKQSSFCHVGFLPQTTGRKLSSKAVSVMLDFCSKLQGAGCQASQFLSCWSFAPNHRARAVKQSSFCHVGFLAKRTGRGLSFEAVSVKLDSWPKPQAVGCQSEPFLSSWIFVQNNRPRSVVRSHFGQVGFLPQTTGSVLRSEPLPSSRILDQTTGRMLLLRTVSGKLDFLTKQQAAGSRLEPAVSVNLDFWPKRQATGFCSEPFRLAWTFGPNHRLWDVVQNRFSQLDFGANERLRAFVWSHFSQVGFLSQTTGYRLSFEAVSVKFDFWHTHTHTHTHTHIRTSGGFWGPCPGPTLREPPEIHASKVCPCVCLQIKY